jgi:hypothetical protein
MIMAPMFALADRLIPLVVLSVTALCFLVVWIFQLLWNSTMPEVFQLRGITFWQAFRILLLAGLLFGSGHVFWVRFQL